MMTNATILNDQESRCQCLADCVNPPLPGKAFCSEHMKFCPRKAPLSGSEPAYEPDRWNLDKAIRLTHNCYSYAMNILDPKQIEACHNHPTCDVPYPQPGYPAGMPKFNDKDPKTCPNMLARLDGDNPVFTPSKFELKCPRGSSKFALVVDEDQDYHFLRQDSNGMFSHKSGSLPVTNVDARGHEIFDAQLANLNYHRPARDALNYDRFCGYFCVPRNIPLWVKVGGSKAYKKTRKGKGKGPALARRGRRTRRSKNSGSIRRK